MSRAELTLRDTLWVSCAKIVNVYAVSVSGATGRYKINHAKEWIAVVVVVVTGEIGVPGY
jgi:hypothetical protein